MRLKNYIFQFSFAVILTVSIFACKQPATNEKGRVLAQVADKVLLESELINDYSSDIFDEKDSTQFANNYIENWIKQQLLVKEAEKKLNNKELNIEHEMELYRQELLIHRFKDLRIQQLFSATISPSEIEKYYKDNIDLFTLNSPIVQVIYLIFPAEIDLPAKFKKQIFSTNEDEIEEREDFIFKYAKKYDDFNNNWIYFEYIKEITKIEMVSNENYLKREKLIEYRNESEIHLVAIENYMMPGEKAPLRFVEPRIRSLIINSKKLDFLREIKDSLYNDALKYDKFRVFN